MYASSTAVAVMEGVKLVSCLLVVMFNAGGLMGLFRALMEEIYMKPEELLKLSVPSLLYTVQNNLLYYALSHLDAATFQVGYQVKILTTAVFSVAMLGKSLSHLQWLSLVILTIGVSMAQLSTQNSADSKANTTAGFVAVLLAACTSGFSGVYFERILKNSRTSLWMRNIQMGVGSVVLALVGVYTSGDWPAVRDHGFFYGYNQVVVSVILLQAVGGLVVAVVVKYADNILKGFAASFSIVTSCILSYFVFDFHPNFLFLIGATLVNVSMYMYSYKPPVKEKGSSSCSSSGGSGSSGSGGGDSSSNSSSSSTRGTSTALHVLERGAPVGSSVEYLRGLHADRSGNNGSGGGGGEIDGLDSKV